MKYWKREYVINFRLFMPSSRRYFRSRALQRKNFSYPQKALNKKFQPRKNRSIIPVTSNPDSHPSSPGSISQERDLARAWGNILYMIWLRFYAQGTTHNQRIWVWFNPSQTNIGRRLWSSPVKVFVFFVVFFLKKGCWTFRDIQNLLKWCLHLVRI